jgi:plasmid stability protein
MSQILVRNLDQDTVERLKRRAKTNRRSLEAEVRAILTAAAERPVQRERSPEFQKFQQDLENGRNRNEAFAEYSRAVVAKRPVDPINSLEDIHAERDKRDARFG